MEKAVNVFVVLNRFGEPVLSTVSETEEEARGKAVAFIPITTAGVSLWSALQTSGYSIRPATLTAKEDKP